uniref:Uncharacterized protein n=1 Tax=Sus scrofa TaxID=9823 RepID=A0A8D1SQ90_PIG
MLDGQLEVGYLLHLLLQSQSPSLKRPLQGRERRYPKGKRGKLMLAGMGRTLQKMEMPTQTRHRKPKVLEMPRNVCAFLVTVHLWRLHTLFSLSTFSVDLTPLITERRTGT